MRSKTLALLWLIALPGCWWPTNQAALDEYDRKVMASSLRMAQLEAAMLEAETHIQQLQESMRAQGAATATRLENLDEVNTEVNKLRGQIEVLRFEVDELKRHFESAALDQERRQLHDEARLRQVEQFLGIKPPPPPSDADLGLETAEGTPGEGEGEGEITTADPGPIPETAGGKLELAVEHMAAGRNAIARVVLEQALKQHAGAPELAEIRYRLGETWANESKWSQAITAFQAVIDNHPKSDWAAWAMLRQGEAFQMQGQGDNAKLFYEEVVRLYPRSDAAKEAKKKLSGR